MQSKSYRDNLLKEFQEYTANEQRVTYICRVKSIEPRVIVLNDQDIHLTDYSLVMKAQAMNGFSAINMSIFITAIDEMDMLAQMGTYTYGSLWKITGNMKIYQSAKRFNVYATEVEPVPDNYIWQSKIMYLQSRLAGRKKI